jgi:hypothetical protein
VLEVPSLHVTGVVVFQMPPVGAFVVPIAPVQYLFAAIAGQAQYNESAAIPALESRRTTDRSNFLFQQLLKKRLSLVPPKNFFCFSTALLSAEKFGHRPRDPVIEMFRRNIIALSLPLNSS